MSTSRHSTSSPHIRGGPTQSKNVGDFKIAQGAVVCSEAQLQGDITIGSHTVIHPTAAIIAEGAPIIIGDNNLIMEKAVIINKKKEGEEGTPLVIGESNVFEFASHCESKSVGSDNTFEAKCFVGDKVSVSERCVIGAGCSVTTNETLSPGTIITGMNNRRWIRQSTVQTSNQQQLEYLAKLLPNFHRLIKPGQSPVTT